MIRRDKAWWMNEVIKPIYAGAIDLAVKNPFIVFFLFLALLFLIAYLSAPSNQ